MIRAEIEQLRHGGRLMNSASTYEGDVYREGAAEVLQKPVDQITLSERQRFKRAILKAWYSPPSKFRATILQSLKGRRK